MSRALKVDPQTAKAHARKLSLSFPRNGIRKTSASGIYTPKPKTIESVKELRNRWSAFVAEHSSMGMKQLRRLEPALYMKLFRRDRKWLRTSVRKCPPIPRVSRHAWGNRDKLLCIQLEERLVSIRDEAPKRRLTVTMLLNLSGAPPWAKRNLHRLRQFRTILMKLAESRAAFAIRKIAALSQAQRGQRMPRWKVYRLAAIRPDLAKNKEVEEAVAKVISENICAIGTV